MAGLISALLIFIAVPVYSQTTDPDEESEKYSDGKSEVIVPEKKRPQVQPAVKEQKNEDIFSDDEKPAIDKKSRENTSNVKKKKKKKSSRKKKGRKASEKSAQGGSDESAFPLDGKALARAQFKFAPEDPALLYDSSHIAGIKQNEIPIRMVSAPINSIEPVAAKPKDAFKIRWPEFNLTQILVVFGALVLFILYRMQVQSRMRKRK